MSPPRASGSESRWLDAFVGREAELAALTSALESAHGGEARTVLVEGAAGLGKTALVRCFAAGADTSTVVWANGVESELEVDLGVVDQLLKRLGSDSHDLRRTDHVTAGAMLLAAIAPMEAQGPIILAIDDAQWIDAPSLRAVLFVARRLVSERVLTIIITRPDECGHLPAGLRTLASGATGKTLAIQPLSAAEVRELAAAVGVQLSVSEARRLHVHTAGSPLYAGAMIEEVPANRWRDPEGAWPAPRSYSALVRRRVDACPSEARRLIEAVSVLGVACELETAIALGGIQDSFPAIEAATQTGLLEYDEEDGAKWLRFPHPLSRVAVYHGLGAVVRERLHLRAAELSDSTAAQLRHRVAAASGADDLLANDLEAFTLAERARGTWSSVATNLAMASRLSTDSGNRTRRLLEAAEAALYTSDAPRARRLVPEIERVEPGAMRDGVLAFVAIADGRPDEAEALLASAWQQCDLDRERSLAAKLAERRAFLGILRLHASDAVRWGRRAMGLWLDDDVTLPLSAWTLVFGLDHLNRHEEALAVLEASIARLSPRTRLRGLPLGDIRGAVLLAADRIDEARHELAQAAPLIQRHGPSVVASFAYSRLALADHAIGLWDDAVAHADLAVALADEANDPGPQTAARHAAIVIAVARGDDADAATHADELERIPAIFENHVARVSIGRACVAMARNEPERVLLLLEPLATMICRDSVDDPGYWPWHHLYADALVESGAFDQARGFIDLYESAFRDRDRRSMSSRLAQARGRALSSTSGRVEAERAFRQAIDDIEPLELPYDLARARVEYGQFLRRGGQRRVAAAQLSAAKERLEALGAAPLLQRCDRELEACGLTPVSRSDPGRRDQLTPRERAVAKLAAAGMSNREIAVDLMLSIKTVERHLTHVFAKTGLQSRNELGAALERTG